MLQQRNAQAVANMAPTTTPPKTNDFVLIFDKSIVKITVDKRELWNSEILLYSSSHERLVSYIGTKNDI